MTVLAYIGLGSNLDDPKARTLAAIDSLANLDDCRLLACSALFRTQAVGRQPQPDYINAAVKLATTLAAEPLLDVLQAIEAAHGRVRDGVRWGPRTLDLDLLLFGEERIDMPRLVVPHPWMTERRFVLAPLLDMEPDLRMPDGRALADLLDRCPPLDVQRLPS